MLDERICSQCERQAGCTGTPNRACLRMALGVITKEAEENTRLRFLLSIALAQIKKNHHEGRCAHCIHHDDTPDEKLGFPLICHECEFEKGKEKGNKWEWSGYALEAALKGEGEHAREKKQ